MKKRTILPLAALFILSACSNNTAIETPLHFENTPYKFDPKTNTLSVDGITYTFDKNSPYGLNGNGQLNNQDEYSYPGECTTIFNKYEGETITIDSIEINNGDLLCIFLGNSTEGIESQRLVISLNEDTNTFIIKGAVNDSSLFPDTQN